MIVFSVFARWVVIDGFECLDRYIDVSHGFENAAGFDTADPLLIVRTCTNGQLTDPMPALSNESNNMSKYLSIAASWARW